MTTYRGIWFRTCWAWRHHPQRARHRRIAGISASVDHQLFPSNRPGNPIPSWRFTTVKTISGGDYRDNPEIEVLLPPLLRLLRRLNVLLLRRQSIN